VGRTQKQQEARIKREEGKNQTNGREEKIWRGGNGHTVFLVGGRSLRMAGPGPLRRKKINREKDQSKKKKKDEIRKRGFEKKKYFLLAMRKKTQKQIYDTIQGKKGGEPNSLKRPHGRLV